MLASSEGGDREHSASEQLVTHQHQAITGTPSDSLAPRRNSNVSPEQELTRRIHRIRRACDECRGRKIKCDGRQPCLHCSSLNLECTYYEPGKRPTRLSRREVEELGSRLQRARNLLHALVPGLDLDDPALGADALGKLRLPTPKAQSLTTTSESGSDAALQSLQHSSTEHDVHLETVLEATGRLDLDELGNWSYQGHGSSSAFVRRLGERFGDISDNTALRLRSIPQKSESLGNSEDQACEGSVKDLIPLPPRDIALELTTSAFNEACAIFNFIHQPSFYSMFDRLYLVDHAQYGHEEHKFIPLLYAIFAVGYLFLKSERAYFGYAHAVSEGTKYFAASRQMLDITECRDLWSLQAVVFMIIFLQSSATMSACHSYVSAAMAASLQMGLHRCQPEAMNPIERETRKRIFWTIRTMETYIVAILGLPRIVTDDDVDQEMPLEVDDQCLTKRGIVSMPDGQVSMITGVNAHTRLIRILGKIVTDVYPTKRMEREASKNTRAYIVNDAKVREVERDLQHWARNLPMHFQPGADSPKELLRVQHLLRLAFTHVQITLYKPFLHYISCSKTDTPTSNQCYAYAAACVDVSRNIIHNARQMEKHDILNGPNWFSLYTTFCATLSLVFYVWNNTEVQEALKTLKDAEYGRDVLAKLAYKSTAAANHSETLAIIFTHLPRRLGKGQYTKLRTQRKRHMALSEQDEPERSYYHQDTIAGGYNSYETFSQNNSSIGLQAFAQTSDSVDLGDFLSLQSPPDPLCLPNVPQRTKSPYVNRFLGPDSIEDIFGLQPRYSSAMVPPSLASTTMISPQTFTSLDQYVSTLDLQGGQAHPFGINSSANGTSTLPWDNATIDTGGQPFIPLSPYLMQIHPPSGSSFVSPEPYELLTRDYDFAGQNDNPQQI